MIDRMPYSIEDEARSLAESNSEADQDIQQIWWFPDEREIRLIEVDPKLPSSDEVAPYCFPPDVHAGVHFPSAIALIRPDEKTLPMPDGWVSWDQAEKVFEREAA